MVVTQKDPGSGYIYPDSGSFPLKLNLGCGEYPMRDFVNVDATASRGVDMVASVPPLPWPDGSASDIYMGHFLEHLSHADATEMLDECFRVLSAGGSLGIVVPDFREVARRYVLGEEMPFAWQNDYPHDLRDLDELNHFILFSTCQPSHHLWAYDLTSLQRALERAGFEVQGEIDRFSDPRLSTPQWYQCGLDARKP